MGRGPQQATGEDAKVQEKLRNTGEIPKHIAVIMDGNGRWAQQRGRPRIWGHQEGVESVRDAVEACGQLGVKYLTLYAFSTENWNRPSEEVSLLMRLLLRAIRDETDRLHRNNVRMEAIGDVGRLPVKVQNELSDGIQKTSGNDGLTLILALSYKRPVGYRSSDETPLGGCRRRDSTRRGFERRPSCILPLNRWYT